MFVKLMLTIIFVAELAVNAPTNIGAINSLALFMLLWAPVNIGHELRNMAIIIIGVKTVGMLFSLSQSSLSNVLVSWEFSSCLLWLMTLQLIETRQSANPKLDLEEIARKKRVTHSPKKVTVDQMENHFTPSVLCVNAEMMEVAKALIQSGHSIYYYESEQYRLDIHKPTGVVAHIRDEDGLLNFVRKQSMNLKILSNALVD